MKFPEGGGFLREVLVVESSGSRGQLNSKNGGGLEVMNSRASRKLIKLLAQLELFGDCLIAADIRISKIVQQTAALADHQKQTTARAVILLGRLQMLGQMVDAVREQRDLHVGGTRVLRVRLELFNRFRLSFHN
jgi:hypothetical protein